VVGIGRSYTCSNSWPLLRTGYRDDCKRPFSSITHEQSALSTRPALCGAGQSSIDATQWAGRTGDVMVVRRVGRAGAVLKSLSNAVRIERFPSAQARGQNTVVGMNLLSVLRHHRRWFFVACMAIGGAVSTLPFLREPNGNIEVLPYLTTWSACGFLAGLLVPDRPWHWGLAMAIGQPIAHIVLDPKNGVWELVLIPLLPVVAAPIVAGAYLGRLVSLGAVTIPDRPTRPIPSTSSSQLLVLFAVGFVVSVIPMFVVSTESSFLLIVWIGAAAAVAATSVAWARSGVLTGTGIAAGVVIAAFMTVVIYDTSTGGPNHHMLPFEVMYVIVATAVPAALVALLTHWLVRSVRPRPNGREA
jgi:hypothetical protein